MTVHPFILCFFSLIRQRYYGEIIHASSVIRHPSSAIFLSVIFFYDFARKSMSLILPVEDKFPQWGENCFIAPNATIVGDVIMGNECSIWFNTVVRGDVNSIRIGN